MLPSAVGGAAGTGTGGRVGSTAAGEAVGLALAATPRPWAGRLTRGCAGATTWVIRNTRPAPAASAATTTAAIRAASRRTAPRDGLPGSSHQAMPTTMVA